MQRDPRLSEEVQTYIDALDLERRIDEKDLSTEERQESDKARAIVEIIVSEVIKSRESLGSGNLPAIESLVAREPELMEHFLDEHYTRQVTGAVSGYVRRTMQLSNMSTSRTASKITNTYLLEATRTYILGLPQACVAVCRAALEQGLKENLGYQGSDERISLRKLIAEAETKGLIDGVAREIASDIACAGNKVLHAGPADFDQARDILYKVRGLLQAIYSGPMH